MKKILIMFILFLGASFSCVSADTVYPAGARYVIVNPNSIVRTTFLLDTKTGKTWQLVTDSKNNDCWQQMEYDWWKQDNSGGGMTRKPPILTAP